MRNKHYLINLTDEESEALETRATQEERTPSTMARMLLVKALKQTAK